MNERVTPGLCSYYFSARFQKLAAPFSFCQARKEKHMFLESKLGHFDFSFLGQAVLVFSDFASNTSRE